MAPWIDPENYHLTLRFAGDVDGATARDFTNALGEVLVSPFELKLNGLDSFGGNKPRTIFAGVAPSPELQALQHAHEGAARVAGLPPERRNFKPHVTIARLRGTRPDAVAGYLQNAGLISESFTVTRFVLYSSRDSVGGGPMSSGAYDLETTRMTISADTNSIGRTPIGSTVSPFPSPAFACELGQRPFAAASIRSSAVETLFSAIIGIGRRLRPDAARSRKRRILWRANGTSRWSKCSIHPWRISQSSKSSSSTLRADWPEMLRRAAPPSEHGGRAPAVPIAS